MGSSLLFVGGILSQDLPDAFKRDFCYAIMKKLNFVEIEELRWDATPFVLDCILLRQVTQRVQTEPEKERVLYET